LTVLFPYYSHLAEGRIIYAFLFGLYSGGLSTMINPLCIEFLLPMATPVRILPNVDPIPI
jgi:hypothetical protein